MATLRRSREPTQVTKVSEPALVRVGPLMGLPLLVKDLGFDPVAVFASVGFNLEEFSDPENKISYLKASKLIARCVEVTGYENLGLMLGERIEPSSLGIAGFLLKTAPDVASALQDLVENLELHDQGGVVTLTTLARKSLLGYTIHLNGVKASDQIYDQSITIACKIMRSLCGDNWNPSEVHLSRRPPKDKTPYLRYFKAPIRFNSNKNALVFPTSHLSQRITTADSFLHSYLEKEALELHRQQGTSILSDLRRMILSSLSTQQNGAAAIAEKLGVHERTLHRRLREKGTTYRQELASIQYSIAQQLLADSTMSLTKIANTLGYADETAFSRAFKRWSSMPPTEWRKRNQSVPQALGKP